jgi:glycosyltransferase involved in cell wall biosynthesis
VRLGLEFGTSNLDQIELSILVPCLNEEESVRPLLERIDVVRKAHGLEKMEVLVLDDSSTDRTFERSVECVDDFPDLNLRVIRRYEPRRGYGAVLRFGMAYARGRYVIPVAADGVDPLEQIPFFLERARKGADLVQCSRYLSPGDAATIPFSYKLFQVIWRSLVRILLRENIRDSTYAFKIFNRLDILALGLQSNRFSASPEMFLKVLLTGGRIEYVAAGQGVRRHGVSKFIFRREGPGYAYVLLRAWLHRTGLVLWF